MLPSDFFSCAISFSSAAFFFWSASNSDISPVWVSSPAKLKKPWVNTDGYLNFLSAFSK